MPKVYKLYIELTGRCNLKCAHCINGVAQNKNINKTHIIQALDVFSTMEWLVLGGGEPFLNQEGMIVVKEYLISNNRMPKNLFISTNGCCENIDAEKTMELIEQMKRFCCNNFILQISNTQYHKASRTKQQDMLLLSFKNKLEERNISYIEYDNVKDKHIIGEGNAKKNRILPSFTPNITYPMVLLRNDDREAEPEFVSKDPLYITFDGNIVVGCHAYDTRSEFKVATIDDLLNSKNKIDLLTERLSTLNLLEYKDYQVYLREKELEYLLEIYN
jgi:organic radical activating enzyme